MSAPTKEEVLAAANWAELAYPGFTPFHATRWYLKEITEMLRAYAAMLEPVSDEEIDNACEAYEGYEHWEFQRSIVKENTRRSMRRSLESFLAGRAK